MYVAFILLLSVELQQFTVYLKKVIVMTTSPCLSQIWYGSVHATLRTMGEKLQYFITSVKQDANKG